MHADQRPILSAAETTQYALDAYVTKATAPAAKIFLLALTGGAFIGIGMVFYLVSQQGAGTMPMGMAKVVGGLVFSIGLSLVVLMGAELFTSATLALASFSGRRMSLPTMLRYWVLVYVGNLLGAATMVALMWFAGSWESNHGALGLVALKTADGKAGHDVLQSLCLGILCNMLVCLAVWLTYAGRTVTDKIAALTLPVAMFVASGFEHSVANMFLLPYALLVKTFAPAGFWAETGTTAATYGHLDWSTIWTANLLPVTLGNIIGGGLMIGVFQVLVHEHLARG